MRRLRDTLDVAKARLSVTRKMLKEAKSELKQQQKHLETAREAQAVLQAVAQSIQQKAHERIAAVVSRCLSTVFADPYEFKIEFEQKRGKTEARLLFVRDGMEVEPRSAAGGGVVDVAAFALRLAALMLSSPQPRKILILDEPFKMLSRPHRPMMRALIETLAEEMGVQFLIITHDKELTTGNIIEID